MNIFGIHIIFRVSLITCSFLCLNNYSLRAQNIVKDIISTAGQFEHSSQVKLQWTLGEISIEQFSENNIIIEEGFHSGFKYQTSTSSQNTPTLQFKLYPNPTNELLFLESKGLAGNYNYSVFNIYGLKVLDGVNTIRSSINLKALSPGIYFILIENSRGYIFTGVVSKI